MAEMPRPETSTRQRVVDYALGIVHEIGWILAWCALVYVMALAATAVLR